MLVNYDPDATVVVSSTTTCPHHLKYPGEPWCGCTCSGMVTTRAATPEEYAAKRSKRLRERRAKLLEELSVLDAELAEYN